MKAKFPSFTYEGQVRQYAYNMEAMFATVNGVEYQAPITEDHLPQLAGFGQQDFVKQARLFDEVSGNIIERETGVKAMASLVDAPPA